MIPNQIWRIRVPASKLKLLMGSWVRCRDPLKWNNMLLKSLDSRSNLLFVSENSKLLLIYRQKFLRVYNSRSIWGNRGGGLSLCSVFFYLFMVKKWLILIKLFSTTTNSNLPPQTIQIPAAPDNQSPSVLGTEFSILRTSSKGSNWVHSAGLNMNL